MQLPQAADMVVSGDPTFACSCRIGAAKSPENSESTARVCQSSTSRIRLRLSSLSEISVPLVFINKVPDTQEREREREREEGRTRERNDKGN